MVFILIVAGHVTTVNLIGNAVLALLTHPEQLARLKANPDLVKGAVEETLRFWGPVEMAAPRFARDDLEFAGTTIPRGRAVLPVLAAADRDPERFPILTASTSGDRTPAVILPSARASTSASARRWPESRVRSLSTDLPPTAGAAAGRATRRATGPPESVPRSRAATSPLY